MSNKISFFVTSILSFCHLVSSCMNNFTTNIYSIYVLVPLLFVCNHPSCTHSQINPPSRYQSVLFSVSFIHVNTMQDLGNSLCHRNLFLFFNVFFLSWFCHLQSWVLFSFKMLLFYWITCLPAHLINCAFGFSTKQPSTKSYNISHGSVRKMFSFNLVLVVMIRFTNPQRIKVIKSFF